MHESSNLVTQFKSLPMQPFQIWVVAICVIINTLDGFDVLVISFTAPEIAAEWSLDPQSLGVLFSAGLFGMAAGSLFIAPLADRIGRRNILLLCLSMISLGMLLSALTQGLYQLVAMRAFTGLGIGGALASLTTIAAEYSSSKRESFSISLVQSGYPIGASIGGVISAFLIVNYSWRAAFLFGALCSLLMIPLVLRCLPESLEYLVSRKPAGALEKLNQLLARLGQSKIDSMPEDKADSTDRPTRVVDIVSPSLRRSTLLIWGAFFMVMLSFYFVLSWTPTLLTEAGLNVEQGISGAVLINIGGIIGGTTLGYFAARFGAARLTGSYMVVCAVAMVIFGYTSVSLPIMLLLGFIIGFFIFGSMIGLYSIVPSIYDASIRNTGMGWAIGIGRIGAILGPSLAGFLLSQGWSGAECFLVFALPLLLSMVCVVLLTDTSLPEVKPE